jgi:hypothetical protein
MTVLDAYAIIAYLRAEPLISRSRRTHPRAHPADSVSAEVCDQMIRVFGSDPDAIEAGLALLGQAGTALVPVSPEMAIEAGRFRARRYHREHTAVSLAAAAALAVQQPLATANPALVGVVRAEGGDIHPPPDSKGRRPMTTAAACLPGGQTDPWLQAEPGVRGCAQDIGERFKSPLGHPVYAGQRRFHRASPAPCNLSAT